MQHPNFDFQVIAESIKRSDKIVFSFDVDQKELMFVNPAFEDIWGISVEEMSNNPLQLIEKIHPEDSEYLKKIFNSLSDGMRKSHIEFRIQRKEDDIRWLTANVQMVKDAKHDRRMITGLIEDITDWKDQEMNMQKYASKKDAVLEILSHDLAGPLQNIKGLANLLSKRDATARYA